MTQSVDVSAWGQETHTPYTAPSDRYAQFDYRRVGRSGLLLPPISLGLWWNFGDTTPFASQREIIRHAFDSGITHFDLANNYGPPFGAAEENFGRIMAKDLKPYRDELIVSSKSGWDMWPGPYGNFGSRKYTLASLDEALTRMGLDYVDIFYSHRVDPDTPLEETIGALDTAVRSGKALYAGISSYSAERTQEASRIAGELGTPLVIHQPAYSMLNRWVEDGLLATLKETGMGSIAFTPLAQGLLTDKYLKNPDAQPAGGRSSLLDHHLSEENLNRLRRLNDVAAARGQTLAQLAIAWLLRDGGATSVLLGASSTAQLDENLAAVHHTSFTTEELEVIDTITTGDAGINIWSVSSEL
ncbi:L-glyceraldehyde 3-phosphate reductase [Nesterenkonia sphaerica]|uniref:L-glyceraldehyde 3-phosphate reductase n=1 Tax=Nesterenkonia sphaerica TaxID=1804988 RepID=A0A5R9A6G3_9MICC|nr:L-glyceraldehyde 3-phosphate reductase [Nesterenkonia sphaerica]TLP74309.1 L-glyceraldehyde 3-phosphate reductase [Nesterenkonia sphaerica]